MQEKLYIFSEAGKQFRANQHTVQPTELDKQVDVAMIVMCSGMLEVLHGTALKLAHGIQILEGELRLQYARQYQIPYPRLEHKTQYRRSHPAPKSDLGREPSAGR